MMVKSMVWLGDITALGTWVNWTPKDQFYQHGSGIHLCIDNII